MTARKRKLYNFLIDPELAAGLKALKTETGVAESESVRRAIAEYLKKRGVLPSRAEGKRAVTRKPS